MVLETFETFIGELWKGGGFQKTPDRSEDNHFIYFFIFGFQTTFWFELILDLRNVEKNTIKCFFVSLTLLSEEDGAHEKIERILVSHL